VATLKSQNWKLIVVGGGGMRHHYERQARALKLGKRVAFAGYVPVAALPEIKTIDLSPRLETNPDIVFENDS